MFTNHPCLHHISPSPVAQTDIPPYLVSSTDNGVLSYSSLLHSVFSLVDYHLRHLSIIATATYSSCGYDTDTSIYKRYRLRRIPGSMLGGLSMDKEGRGSKNEFRGTSTRQPSAPAHTPCTMFQHGRHQTLHWERFRYINWVTTLSVGIHDSRLVVVSSLATFTCSKFRLPVEADPNIHIESISTTTEMAHRQSGGYKEEPGVSVANDHRSCGVLLHWSHLFSLQELPPNSQRCTNSALARMGFTRMSWRGSSFDAFQKASIFTLIHVFIRPSGWAGWRLSVAEL
ncbi:hypothetical protein WAI453_012039 [Rhynchosporium graminicola]